MTLTAPMPRVSAMSEPAEVGTKTVRLPSDMVNQLQTISAMETEMGVRFKVVEFIADLVGDAITARYADTYRRFTEFKAAKGKSQRRKSE